MIRPNSRIAPSGAELTHFASRLITAAGDLDRPASPIKYYTHDAAAAARLENEASSGNEPLLRPHAAAAAEANCSGFSPNFTHPIVFLENPPYSRRERRRDRDCAQSSNDSGRSSVLMQKFSQIS